MAAQEGHRQVCLILLAWGADGLVPNNNNHTSLGVNGDENFQAFLTRAIQSMFEEEGTQIDWRRLNTDVEEEQMNASLEQGHSYLEKKEAAEVGETVQPASSASRLDEEGKPTDERVPSRLVHKDFLGSIQRNRLSFLEGWLAITDDPKNPGGTVALMTGMTESRIQARRRQFRFFSLGCGCGSRRSVIEEDEDECFGENEVRQGTRKDGFGSGGRVYYFVLQYGVLQFYESEEDGTRDESGDFVADTEPLGCCFKHEGEIIAVHEQKVVGKDVMSIMLVLKKHQAPEDNKERRNVQVLLTAPSKKGTISGWKCCVWMLKLGARDVNRYLFKIDIDEKHLTKHFVPYN